MANLHIAEHFYSLQGEGATAGCPAVFLRLQGCPLACQWCDTTVVWQQGLPYSYDGFVALLTTYFKTKQATHVQPNRLVLTGGEPLVQQRVFNRWWRDYWAMFKIPRVPIVEVETAGVIDPIPEMLGTVDQWNISPKLSHSGVTVERRLKPVVLRTFAKLSTQYNIHWKFVVATEDHVDEVASILRMAYAEDYKGTWDNVWLMPLASNQLELNARGPEIARLCMKYGYNFGNRLQVQIWNQTVGV